MKVLKGWLAAVTIAMMTTTVLAEESVQVQQSDVVATQTTTQATSTMKDNQSFHVPAKAAIAVDAESGQILYKQNIDQTLPIASMTKMISCAVVVDAINNGTLSWDEPITISSETANLSANSELSNVPLIAGESYTVQDLFNATIVQSANAAIMALADKVAGSQEKFIQLMNDKLKEWGINDAHIVTVSGLNNEYLTDSQRLKGSEATDENKMTARDMAIVSQHIVNDYPEYMKISRQSVVTFAKGTQSATDMTNWNQMLPNQPVYTEGVTGLKTGTTEKAGACFAGSIEKNGFKVVTVVMNVDNGVTDKTARFTATRDLMSHVYQQYERKTIIKKGSTIKGLDHTDVPEGKKQQVSLVSQSDVHIVIKKDSQTDYELANIKKEKLLTPVRKGEVAASFEVKLKHSLGYINQSHAEQYKAVTNEEDEKANLFVLGFRHVKDWFTQLF